MFYELINPGPTHLKGLGVSLYEVPHYDGAYAVGTDSLIYSRRRKAGWRDGWVIGEIEDFHPLSSILMPTTGYLFVNLYRNGKSQTRTVHSLICECIHGPCPNGLQTRHLDGNRTNNSFDNV